MLFDKQGIQSFTLLNNYLQKKQWLYVKYAKIHKKENNKVWMWLWNCFIWTQRQVCFLWFK
jgi:hypothetical protein